MMRPTDRVIEVQGNIPGQKIQMGFDPGSIAHIMSVLTDLYSDPIMAIVREYATNAWDSHVEAGQTRPIEVSTPNPLSQFYRVKDYGIGLNVDDIERIYAMYGASTKRDTDDQTGMLGLGSKSALTHTNQFTLIAVKDGVKVTVSVSRQPDGTGAMNIVDTCSTTEPNGVEITIPAAMNSPFKQKAMHFFSFWKEGTYLLDGETVRSHTEGMREVEPGLFIEINPQVQRPDYVVMGGVAYPVDANRLNTVGLHRPWRMVAFVNIGDVHFTPSRESLQYTPLTVKTIEDIRDRVNACVESEIQKTISEATTHGEAMRLLSKYRGALRSNAKIKYKGLEIPGAVSLKDVDVLSLSHYGRNKYHVSRWESYQGGKSWVCVVIPDGDISQQGRRVKIRRWFTQENIVAEKVIIVSDATKLNSISPFLDEIKTYVLSDMKIVRDPNTYSYGSMGPQGLIVTRLDKGIVTCTKEFDLAPFKGKTLVYFSPAEKLNSSYVSSAVSILDVVAVELAAGRFKKLERETGAVHIREYISNVMKDNESALTEADKIKFYLANNHNRWYNEYVNIKPSVTVTDPDVLQWLRAIEMPYTKAAKLHQAFKGSYYKPAKMVDPIQKYVLIGHALNYTYHPSKELMEHSIFYMNAAYAAGKV